MVTLFHETQVQVQIQDILIRSGIPEENALKIVLVELPSMDADLLT
jgi:hypothetical protein